MKNYTAAITFCLLMAATGHADTGNLDSTRIALGKFEYRTTLVVGDTIVDIDSTRRITLENSASAETLQIETVTHTGMGPTDDRLELNAKTLMPVRREVRQGDGEMRIDFAADRVTGYIQAAGQTVPVDVALNQPAYAGESGLEAVLAAMPLNSGQETELHVLEIDVNTRVRHVRAHVGEVEAIEVPAGRFQAWPVHLSAADEFDDEQTVWISNSKPRVFVRAEAPVPADMGGGSLVTVLTAVSD